MQRTDSIFKSTKLFVQGSVALTTDTIQLVRAELQHTKRLNSLENDSEYSDALLDRIMDLLTRIEEANALPESNLKTIKLDILNKELAKLS